MTSLAPLLAFGLVADRPLFLDLEHDSYFLLEGPDEDAVLDQLADRSRGTVVIDGGRQAQWTKADKPRSAVLDHPLPRPSLTTTGQVMFAIAATRRRLARKSLARVLEASVAISLEPADERLAMYFAAARGWVPRRPHCLVDSLALVAWLRRRERSATLIFGAKLHPFAAHCWVESGGVLLNDHLEDISRFTPVLRIGG